MYTILFSLLRNLILTVLTDYIEKPNSMSTGKEKLSIYNFLQFSWLFGNSSNLYYSDIENNVFIHKALYIIILVASFRQKPSNIFFSRFGGYS